jgi:choline dehydrogenase-like flavoprotein
MTKSNTQNHYDVIIVGSGTCGATIAKELSRQKKKVLVLERGETVALKESFFGILPIMNEVSVADKLKDMRALTTGGTTALYFGVAAPPPLDTFSSLGVDITKEYEEAQKELPVDYLPDELYGPQAIKLRDSAEALGHSWEKQLMLLDLSKCQSGYSYEAKWKAKSYVDDALEEGATLKTRAKVTKIIIENKKAIGVEYQLRTTAFTSTRHKVFGDKVVLAAGVLASPFILRETGVKNVADKGFYFDPNRVYFGLIPGLNSKDNYVGAMQTNLEEDIVLGDGNVNKFFFQFLMASMFKPKHFFSFSESIGIGVKVHEPMGGKLLENGKYHKEVPKEAYTKLEKGEEEALKILKNTGAKHIVKSPMYITNTGGVLRINDHVDTNLETEFENLYVCDRSILPDTFRKPPTLALVCLGKYLANHLLASN